MFYYKYTLLPNTDRLQQVEDYIFFKCWKHLTSISIFANNYTDLLPLITY